ncbi:hypothetical protein Glove_21g359 [Diversispora epigaea]|nr:hypothetical protein Glove_21g359 [Diversispora epigaea]
MDNIYNIDNRDNIMNFVEDITNERDTELFLDLLSTHSPITLNKIELNGDWRITKKILHKFLENWNSRKELGLEMNICALGFFQDCSKILKEYTDKGVLKKFSYE